MPDEPGSPEPAGRLDPASTEATDAEARIAELEDEVRSLRKELWQARDATIGATATAGSYKARNVELEMLIHQLRTELAHMDAALAVARGSLTGRVNAALSIPGRAARKILRP